MQSFSTQKATSIDCSTDPAETEFLHQDVDQVLDYALDLKNFHQGSIDRFIIPILVATESKTYSTDCRLSHYDDGVYEPLLTDANHLSYIINLALADNLESNTYSIPLADWARSRYSPTPTIIEAARSLYLNHSVEDITRHEADKVSTDRTIAYILALYGMNVIDSGVAVMNMHAPWEATSKADVYEVKRGYGAFLAHNGME